MTSSRDRGADVLLEAARGWLQALQECVRQVDYDRGRTLFTEDVVAFGTRANLVHGLDALQAHQWSNVWPNITDFTFDLDQVDCRGDEQMAIAVVPWASTGYHADGTAYDRPGRATVGLVHRGDAWLAMHTHFSLTPGTPPISVRKA